MDLSNHVIQLCIEGSRAEFEDCIEESRRLYQQAWEARKDDHYACIAAHYVARFQENPKETLHWNQIALDHVRAVKDERVREFYPSLYLNMGRSYEVLGDAVNAEKFYDLAAELGVTHQDG